MSAAFIAGLVTAHGTPARPLGNELSRIWTWFEAGHWPCGYAQEGKRRLLVL